MPYINLSKIELPKHQTDYNIWADVIELLVLLNPDRSLSVEAIKDRLLDENDGDAKKALRQLQRVSAKTIHLAEDKLADDQFESDNNPETEQIIKTGIIGIIGYMKCRKRLAPEHYPFEIDAYNSLKCVELKTEKQNTYIILLLSSLIRFIHREGGFSYRLTHAFEKLCEAPFKRLIPELATVEFFGAGGDNTSISNSHLFYDKIERLSKKLHLPLHPLFTKENAGKNNVGDGGLDWVAYFSFNDQLSMLPTYFAQCACGNDWEDKLLDANKAKWQQFMLINYDYPQFHFIPKSFRNTDNQWLNPTHLHTAMLVDRFRLMELLDKADTTPLHIEPYRELLQELENTELLF